MIVGMIRIVLAFFLAFQPALAADAKQKPLLLDWEALLPEGEIERLEEMQKAQAAPGLPHSFGGFDGPGAQIGTFNTVPALDGKLVRVPGFVLPFEYTSSGKITEFLLVPYFGACIHLPPPPPNQMIYVKTSKPVDVGKIWSAIYVVGILRAAEHRHEIADAAYTLEMQDWELYEE